jgi:polysaccharide export outer membrane protein
MRKIIFLFLSVCFSLATVTAQNGPATVTPPQTPTVNDSFIIGPEDVLTVTVWREPELTTNRVNVRPDGKIGVPLLNDVQASGLTTGQLQEQITEGLKKFVADPNVSVIVLEVHSQVVHILGGVNRPGAYILGSPLTVVELLARAGGVTEFAKTEQVQIVRKDNGKNKRFVFNYKKFVEGKNFEQNIQLRSGDVVTIPL